MEYRVAFQNGRRCGHVQAGVQMLTKDQFILENYPVRVELYPPASEYDADRYRLIQKIKNAAYRYCVEHFGERARVKGLFSPADPDALWEWDGTVNFKTEEDAMMFKLGFKYDFG
jgi:hypothetical protein